MMLVFMQFEMLWFKMKQWLLRKTSEDEHKTRDNCYRFFWGGGGGGGKYHPLYT